MIDIILAEFKSRLLTAFGLTSADFLVLDTVLSPEGKPNPGCGEVFIAIHPTLNSWRPYNPVEADAASLMFGEQFEVGVTISRRVNLAPTNAQYSNYWQAAIQANTRLVLSTILAAKYSIIDSLNSTLTDTDKLLGHGVNWDMPKLLQEVDAEWFGATPSKSERATQAPYGYYNRLIFSGFHRLQRLANIYS